MTQHEELWNRWTYRQISIVSVLDAQDGVMWHEEKRDAAQKVLMHVRQALRARSAHIRYLCIPMLNVQDMLLWASLNVIELFKAKRNKVTKGSVSYLSSPCFSTIIGGIGGPARAKRRILGVMYWISIIKGGEMPPPLWNGYGFNSHVTRGTPSILSMRRCPCSPA